MQKMFVNLIQHTRTHWKHAYTRKHQLSTKFLLIVPYPNLMILHFSRKNIHLNDHHEYCIAMASIDNFDCFKKGVNVDLNDECKK